MTVRAYVGVGSNIDAERNVQAAIALLKRSVRVVGLSMFYRTRPLVHSGDPWFINGVVAIDTDVPPLALKRGVLQHIEDELGRRRSDDRNAPRTIDLDLLIYDRESHRTEALTLPDPQIAERAFLAWPLLDLDDAIEMPGGQSIRAVAERLPRDGMIPLRELTEVLREEIDHE